MMFISSKSFIAAVCSVSWLRVFPRCRPFSFLSRRVVLVTHQTGLPTTQATRARDQASSRSPHVRQTFRTWLAPWEEYPPWGPREPSQLTRSGNGRWDAMPTGGETCCSHHTLKQGSEPATSASPFSHPPTSVIDVARKVNKFPLFHSASQRSRTARSSRNSDDKPTLGTKSMMQL